MINSLKTSTDKGRSHTQTFKPGYPMKKHQSSTKEQDIILPSPWTNKKSRNKYLDLLSILRLTFYQQGISFMEIFSGETMTINFSSRNLSKNI